jgi:hypothetical protein
MVPRGKEVAIAQRHLIKALLCYVIWLNLYGFEIPAEHKEIDVLRFAMPVEERLNA